MEVPILFLWARGFFKPLIWNDCKNKSLKSPALQSRPTCYKAPKTQKCIVKSEDAISRRKRSQKQPFFNLCNLFLDGGNRALVNRVLVETNIEASKTRYLKAFQSLKNCLD